MLLAIDSSFYGYSALCHNGQKQLFAFENQGSKSQGLIDDIQDAFTKHGIEPQDLTKLALNIGPGSFTGIRTALTFAKTLEASLDLEIMTVNSFELLRHHHQVTGAIAFSASNKNDNEFFVSLDDDYTNIETNFFANEPGTAQVLEFPSDKSIAELIFDFVQNNATKNYKLEPYYLREPSLRKAKAKI